MDVINFGDKTHKNTRYTITIGAFDALHLGHIYLIKEAKRISLETNSKLMVVTFKENPKIALKRVKTNKNLIDFENSLEIYEKLGVDTVNIIDFSLSFSKLSSEEFFNSLSDVCSLVAVVVGLDFCCGNSSNRNKFELQKIVSSLSPSILTYQVKLLKDKNNNIISSSLLRNLLQNGNISVIESILGRFYEIRVKFHKSKCKLETKQMLPKDGSYVVKLDNNQTIIEIINGEIANAESYSYAKTILFIKEL